MVFTLIVLGIDPGNHITGYGIIEKRRSDIQYITHGEIKLARSSSSSSCLTIIYNNLLEIIEKTVPDIFAIEDIFYGKNIRSLIRQGEVRGVAILAAAQNKIPVYEYSPLQIKKAVVGYGRAEKYQVQTMVKAILKLQQLPSEDAADALAVAICHINNLMKTPI